MATCLPTNRTEKIATQATRNAFTKFAASVCIDPLTFDTGAKDDYPSEANMLQCNGTMYRQCKLPGHSVAMCYNARLMPITCNSNMLPIEMRRR
uniref:WLGC domain-containing protein n=1 Tax=Globisporangium ultimum (strain ATCC 200006 / CBS 805.95 / DAOM BR144) TaxID=431595 RepID=K3WTE5_GLOUD